MSLLNLTFKMADIPSPPMSWEDYAKRVELEWSGLLASASNESEVQRFLEEHPSLLPTADSHCPYPGAVISQPKLQGLTRRVPDFMWICSNSVTIIPVLIEIEHPKKMWYNGKGDPTAEFTQAVNQLRIWRTWMEDSDNQNVFRSYYGLRGGNWRGMAFKPRYVLIYGRRAEFESGKSAALKHLRRSSQLDSEEFMTFDRLRPNRLFSDFLSVRARDNQGFEAISFPACVKIGPSFSALLDGVKDITAAISKSPWLTPERRQFLIDRVPYWENWRDLPGLKIRTGESE
ncbi:MAG TPA: Shedu anti-phage system protein SduA domain-containing protein [Verrucomicrobiales bacterium]|jgi:hypothetical protein|nr:Shedu anti-phage system protein SduA domain-containing protein [Verrucomicrobiales bacterium]